MSQTVSQHNATGVVKDLMQEALVFSFDCCPVNTAAAVCVIAGGHLLEGRLSIHHRHQAEVLLLDAKIQLCIRGTLVIMVNAWC